MTMPPTESDSAHPADLDGHTSGTVETVRPISKQADPAWASDEWVTATVPIFVEPLKAGQEDDVIAAVVSALDGDHVRIQRVIDALTELMLSER